MTPKPLQKGCWPDGTHGPKTLYRVKVGPGIGGWQVAGLAHSRRTLYPVVDEVPVLPVELVEGLRDALEGAEGEIERLAEVLGPPDEDIAEERLESTRAALASYRQALGEGVGA